MNITKLLLGFAPWILYTVVANWAGPASVPAALAFFTGASQFEQPIGAISAASVVVTIPIIIMVLIFQRRIVAGLTAGAVKG